VSRYAEPLDGTDLLHPPVRALFNETRAQLALLAEQAGPHVGPIEATEPDEALVAQWREIAAREAAP
jgi:hypothetical protein